MKFDVKDADLANIFECGQCFRWEREDDGSYTGIAAGGHVANIKTEKGGDVISVAGPAFGHDEEADATERSFWNEYLDIERDYRRIRETLSEKDESGVMEKASEYGKGIRILRQDPWEATVSFIISQNNNIPRIKNNIRDLSSLFGEEVCEWRGVSWYDVPSPERLASLTVEDLAPVRLGYRARYLIETAACVRDNGISVIEDDPGSLCGVGPKVENCIRLFGLNQLDSFPIDVWVKKVMSESYGIDSVKEMASFAEKTFGAYGGIAQQYLFYYMREKNRK